MEFYLWTVSLFDQTTSRHDHFLLLPELILLWSKNTYLWTLHIFWYCEDTSGSLEETVKFISLLEAVHCFPVYASNDFRCWAHLSLTVFHRWNDLNFIHFLRKHDLRPIMSSAVEFSRLFNGFCRFFGSIRSSLCWFALILAAFCRSRTNEVRVANTPMLYELPNPVPRRDKPLWTSSMDSFKARSAKSLKPRSCPRKSDRSK